MSVIGGVVFSALLFCVCITAAPTFHGEDHAHLVGPFGVDPTLDCATRNFTYAYANSLLPSRAPLVSVFDALRLAADCDQTRPTALPWPVLRTHPLTSGAFFVDAAHGSDTNNGTEGSPFATPARALQATRAAGGGGHIVLRDSAPFYLTAPLLLTPRTAALPSPPTLTRHLFCQAARRCLAWHGYAWGPPRTPPCPPLFGRQKSLLCKKCHSPLSSHPLAAAPFARDGPTAILRTSAV